MPEGGQRTENRVLGSMYFRQASMCLDAPFLLLSRTPLCSSSLSVLPTSVLMVVPVSQRLRCVDHGSVIDVSWGMTHAFTSLPELSHLRPWKWVMQLCAASMLLNQIIASPHGFPTLWRSVRRSPARTPAADMPRNKHLSTAYWAGPRPRCSGRWMTTSFVETCL